MISANGGFPSLVVNIRNFWGCRNWASYYVTQQSLLYVLVGSRFHVQIDFVHVMTRRVTKMYS